MPPRTAIAVPALVLAALLAAPAAALASSRSTRVSFVRDRTSSLLLEEGGIQVTEYRFARLVNSARNPLKLGQGPAVHFQVRNAGNEPRDFALAAALFDKAGNLVGAGTGSHTGKLEPGETQEIKVVFKDVNEAVARAAWLYMTVETQR